MWFQHTHTMSDEPAAKRRKLNGDAVSRSVRCQSYYELACWFVEDICKTINTYMKLSFVMEKGDRHLPEWVNYTNALLFFEEFNTFLADNGLCFEGNLLSNVFVTDSEYHSDKFRMVWNIQQVDIQAYFHHVDASASNPIHTAEIIKFLHRSTPLCTENVFLITDYLSDPVLCPRILILVQSE